jgi:hypothetical protein
VWILKKEAASAREMGISDGFVSETLAQPALAASFL